MKQWSIVLPHKCHLVSQKVNLDHIIPWYKNNDWRHIHNKWHLHETQAAYIHSAYLYVELVKITCWISAYAAVETKIIAVLQTKFSSSLFVWYLLYNDSNITAMFCQCSSQQLAITRSAWRRKVTSRYLSQWGRSVRTHLSVTRPRCVITVGDCHCPHPRSVLYIMYHIMSKRHTNEKSQKKNNSACLNEARRISCTPQN